MMVLMALFHAAYDLFSPNIVHTLEEIVCW